MEPKREWSRTQSHKKELQIKRVPAPQEGWEGGFESPKRRVGKRKERGSLPHKKGGKEDLEAPNEGLEKAKKKEAYPTRRVWKGGFWKAPKEGLGYIEKKKRKRRPTPQEGYGRRILRSPQKEGLGHLEQKLGSK